MPVSRLASLLVVLVAIVARPATAGDDAASLLPELGPGPYAIQTDEWDFGQVTVSHPFGGTSTLQVDHFGVSVYPVDAPGPRPFIVFAHGRFQQQPWVNHNHEQASYLLEHLASWGFHCASVNLDVVGQFATPAAIPQRGELVHHTIGAFMAQAADGQDIDFNNIGLVGHSRGGEGVVAAAVENPDGHAIRAVATIAPTDFDKFVLQGIPYLSLYGSKDGDVNNGWPIKLYDRSGLAEKAFEYIHGANHFWFTDQIHFGGEGPGLFARKKHHWIATTYISAFLRRALGGQTFPLLADNDKLAPLTDEVTILPSYRRPDGFVVNDFNQWPIDPTLNTLGLMSTGNDMLVIDEHSLQQGGTTLYHQTKGSQLEYDTSAGGFAYYVEELPPGTDVSRLGFVSLRALQTLSDHGSIPWPMVHAGFQFPSKSVLSTTRIPLSAFQEANPELDLRDLAFVALVFDQRPSGDLRVDDIEFTD
jgi:dienelactone hydrolase